MSKEEMENSSDYFAFNRTIFQMLEDNPERTKTMLVGKELALFLNKVKYDPKFGIHETLEDMSEEQMAYLEDFVTG